jgi:hypothetical protein
MGQLKAKGNLYMDFVLFNTVKAILISFCKRGNSTSLAENRRISKIFGFKREEVTVGWNKLHKKRSFIICCFHKILECTHNMG